jgi:hypothetical protein
MKNMGTRLAAAKSIISLAMNAADGNGVESRPLRQTQPDIKKRGLPFGKPRS